MERNKSQSFKLEHCLIRCARHEPFEKFLCGINADLSGEFPELSSVSNMIQHAQTWHGEGPDFIDLLITYLTCIRFSSQENKNALSVGGGWQ
jgi:hypothetical protein